MKHTPTEEQIKDAEMRAAESRERTRAAVANFRSLVDANVADVHAKIHRVEQRISQPSSLGIAFGAGALIGKLLQRSKPRQPKRKPSQVAGGLVATLGAVVSRFGWRFISSSLLRLWASRERYVPPRPAARPPRPVALPPAVAPAPVSRNSSETVH